VITLLQVQVKYSTGKLNFTVTSIVAQSFEQLTGLVHQIWLYLTQFTHCA